MTNLRFCPSNFGCKNLSYCFGTLSDSIPCWAPEVIRLCESRQDAKVALLLSSGRDVQYWVALALALTNDTVRSRALADDLDKRFPEDTLVRFNFLPTLNAMLVLSRNEAVKALEVLQTSAPYELGYYSMTSPYPVYVRGEAYLAAHQAKEASVEFQKILDHRGIVLNEPIGALAHLQIGRAYAMAGDTAKAKAAYQTSSRCGRTPTPTSPS